MARYLYVLARKDATRSISRYIEQVHAQVQYSMLTNALELERDHSPLKGLRVAGDPLSKDIIFTFGNDSVNGHWYCLILDNRPTEKSITLYDSGRPKRGEFQTLQEHLQELEEQLQERCSFFIKYLNALHSYANVVHNIGWSHNLLRESDFSFIDGNSVQQKKTSIHLISDGLFWSE